MDIAWSPKADQIAVLDPSYLAIFDSATGAELAFAQLDPIVVPEVRAAVAAAPTPIAGSSGSVTLSNILYQQVLWSPDGGSIAVLFEACGDT